MESSQKIEKAIKVLYWNILFLWIVVLLNQFVPKIPEWIGKPEPIKTNTIFVVGIEKSGPSIELQDITRRSHMGLSVLNNGSSFFEMGPHYFGGKPDDALTKKQRIKAINIGKISFATTKDGASISVFDENRRKRAQFKVSNEKCLWSLLDRDGKSVKTFEW